MNIKVKDITKHLLEELPKRSQDILTKRYGLGKVVKRETLEGIGQEYKITRERVRQIEAFALNLIRKSKAYADSQSAFDQLKKTVDDFGGIVHEQIFLDTQAKDRATQNQIHFLLVVSDAFTKLREDDDFHHRWTTSEELATKVHQSLKSLCTNFSEGDLVSEPELVERFLKELKGISTDPKVAEFAEKWLLLSKSLAKNPLGEWGLASSPNIRMRGIRDYAYLVLRKAKKPLHFSEVAKEIQKTFGREAHPATCHNELIKDNRFVLVGRGLYALTEWGYTKGTVIEVIQKLIKEKGPLTRPEVIDLVSKQRQVKLNTIIVNLQNPKFFKRIGDGRFAIAKV
ncbi:MAG: sigma factor-like helix-turn-helix DNA-binding protein [Candidatus Paceibacterota bacterium]|jgi:hypothetical protein